MTDQPKTKRRWLQFSLRTLFIVVTVFCVWMGITAKQARDQRLAVEAILKLGGYVVFEHGGYEPQMGGSFNYDISNVDPPGPEWLRKLTGDEYFFRVAMVSLKGPEVNDANLPAISRLADLKWLYLSETNVTDAGVEQLKYLTDLTVVNLSDTQVTDAGLEHLSELTNLQTLYIKNTHVTFEGVKKLRQTLPNCMIFSSARAP